MIYSTTIASRSFDVTVASAAGDTYLVHGRDAFRVNKVAIAIWNLLEGEETVSEISDRISSQYDVSSEQAEKDVLEFCVMLDGRGLLEIE